MSVIRRATHSYCSHLPTLYDHSARDKSQLLFPNYPYNYKGDSKDWKGFCNNGRMQSPIDLTHPLEVPSHSYKHHSLQFTYNKCIASGYFNPNTFIVIKNFGTMALLNRLRHPVKTFEALQFHFHAPSEHTIDGRHYAAEMHIVHHCTRNPTDLAVAAVLFDEGPASPFLDTVINPTGKVDLMGFVEGKSVVEDFYYYFGSLTTPMCDEIVRWFVLKQVMTLSQEQLHFFQSRWAHNPDFAGGRGNNRPINQRNKRNVLLFQG